MHVRIDVNKIAGKPLSTNPRAISFAMLPVPDQAIGVKSTLRLWIQHPKGDVVDVEDAKANVRAPFSWNWGRVFLLIIISIFIALWNPWSKLWKIRLNTKSINQRLLLTLFWTPFLLIAIFAIFWNVLTVFQCILMLLETTLTILINTHVQQTLYLKVRLILIYLFRRKCKNYLIRMTQLQEIIFFLIVYTIFIGIMRIIGSLVFVFWCNTSCFILYPV